MTTVDPEGALLRLGPRRADLLRGLVERDGDEPIRLTTREVRLLEYLSERPGQDITREELLREVWGYGPRVVSRTVDTTMQRLRRKVEEDPRQPRFLTTAHGTGYRFVPDRAPRPEELRPPTPSTSAVSSAAGGHDLGPEADRFIGRTEERAALTGLLREAPGLVTIHGPGGVGKTRLARRAARDLLESGEISGGVCFADLTEARDEADVVASTAAAAGIPLGDSDLAGATDRIAASLSARGPCLLVLDNAEQVIEGVAALAGRLRPLAPELRLVVTSRETLGLAGERVVAPLPLLEADAVELFVERARRVRPGFGESEEDRSATAELARRLEGLPLALELAAARAGVLGPTAMLDRLERRFQLLAGTRRDLPPRQRTLRGALDWSWDLLSGAERDALCQVSVFRGGFDPADAEVVLDLSAHADAPWTVDLLQALRDKSLIQGREDREGLRLTLLDSVREYAEEKLGAGAAPVRARHSRAVLDRCELLAERAEGADAEGARSALRREQDNLRAVAERIRNPSAATRALILLERFHGDRLHTASLGRIADGIPTPDEPELHARLLLTRAKLARLNGDVDRAAAVLEAARAGSTADALLQAEFALQEALVAETRGRRAEAEACFRKGLSLFEGLGDVAGACRARASLGYLLRESGQEAEAEEVLRRALAEARAANLPGHEAKLLSTLGLLVGGAGDPEAGRELLERSLAAHERLGSRRAAGVASANLAALAMQQGRLEDAEARYRAARASLAAVGERRFEAVVRRNLGVVRVSLGRVEEAEEDFRAALVTHRAMGDVWHAARAAADLGEVSMHRGRLDDAERRYEEALAVAEESGDRRYRAIGLGNLSLVALLRGELDEAEERFDRALSALQEDSGPRAHAYFLAFAGALAAEQGRPDLAASRLEEAHLALDKIGDRKGLAVWSVCRAVLERSTGDADAARARVRDLEDAAESVDVAVALRLLARVPGGQGPGTEFGVG